MSLENPSAAELGVWRCISTEHTLVHPPGFEPPPALVRVIREFDKRYVPVWLRKTYIAPTGEVLTMGYHVIGRHVRERDEKDTPKFLGDPLRLELQALGGSVGFRPRPGQIYAQRTWSAGWPKGSLARKLMLPDIYLDFDWDLVSWMRAGHHFMFDERWPVAMRVREAQRAQRTVEQRIVDRVYTDARYRLQQEDVKGAARDELHRMEHPRQYTDHLPPAPKPFVDMGAAQTGAL